jgi:BRCA1-associated protein
MYYILIETEQKLRAWIDDMDPQAAESSNSELAEIARTSSSQSVPSATKEGEEAVSSSCVSHVEVSIPGSPSLRRSSGITVAARPESENASSSTSMVIPDKKRSTYNVLEAMAGPSMPLPQIKKKLAFTSGNPAVETVHGIIHLYNEHPMGSSAASIGAAKTSRMVCIVAVPNWLSVADLMDFFEAEHLTAMEGIRVLADSSPNKYMVVVKFREAKEASDFVAELNGRPFSAMSENGTPEVCHCAFVKYVDFVKPTGKSKQESVSSSTMFPYGAMAGPSLVEIPNCPVCLERLDTSVSGLLTILCNHTFHCTCLMQWKEDNTCPVCRFTQQPAGHESLCSKCGTHEGLWICLLCGHVGCSRYQDSHAYTHYKETFHNYALELASQRVWDYAGDGYVHRLIQNKSDGKLVELPSIHSSSNARPEHVEDKDGLQKVDAIYLEYQYLLTAQLETQRSWFEQKMREHEEIRAKQLKELEQQQKLLKEQLAKAATRNKQLEMESSQYISSQFEKDKQIRDLEDQLRDLMVSLDARKAIGNEGELADGSVLYLSNPDSRISAASSSLPSTPAREALRRKLAKKNKK